ncbi:MAG: hypothetical protein LAQ69_37155 [Acidobacteriia bacterium]|nr:hypothetical protein [Terriglobia bacterium]
MKNSPFAPARLARLALAATLLACGTVEMFAQAAPTSQDLQALVAEITELKSRLATVEAKLAAYQSPPVVPAVKPAVESQPSMPTTGVPSMSAAEHPTAKPAPFAFGDFTWMNGQSRQKSQPLSNGCGSFAFWAKTPSINTIAGMRGLHAARMRGDIHTPAGYRVSPKLR